MFLEYRTIAHCYPSITPLCLKYLKEENCISVVLATAEIT